MNINILGYIAIGTSACSTVPQLIQIIKTKRVRDLNAYFFILESSSMLMYIIYGILKKDYIMMGSAITPFISKVIVLGLWNKYKKDISLNNDEEKT